MTRIDFYHLQKQSLDEVLPKLLAKAYATKERIKIKTVSEEKSDYLNTYLWTFNEESFLPHGTKKDGFVEEQPIFIGYDDNNNNDAVFLFLVDGAEENTEEMSKYTRIFNIFNGKNEQDLIKARQFWSKCKSAGFEVCYWQQADNGSWQQKA